MYRLKINGPPEPRPKLSVKRVCPIQPKVFRVCTQLHKTKAPRANRSILQLTHNEALSLYLNKTLISGTHLRPVQNNPTKLLSPWASPGYKLMKHLRSVPLILVFKWKIIYLRNLIYKIKL